MTPDTPPDNRKHTHPYKSFDHEYHGKTVKITLSDGSSIIGKAEASQYWIKVEYWDRVGKKTVYVNKAHVVKIEPMEG